MLKASIVAEVTSEMIQYDPELILRIPKRSQKTWQVDSALRESPELIYSVNPDLIKKDLADYIISEMVKYPNEFLSVINYLPKKYHNKDMVDSVLKSIKNISDQEGSNFLREFNFVGYTKYFQSIRDDLITPQVFKFLRDYKLNYLIKKIDSRKINKYSEFKPFNKDIKRGHLPKNLDKMQIVILRYMRNNDLDVITVPQLKKANLVTPDTEKMIQFYKGKPLTIKDIISYKTEDTASGTLFNFIRKNIKPIYIGKHLGIQILFKDKNNHVFGLALKNVDKLLKQYPELEYVLDNETHFESPLNNTLLLGWVRYTKFGKDIWIDEVQSDIAKDSSFKNLLNNDTVKIYDLVLNEFIRNMHRRGSGKLVIPSYEAKTSLYKGYGTSNPPRYVYTKLPKKFRFKKDTVTNIDDKVDGLNSWILAHVKK